MNKVALTFDDGPNEYATIQILDILDSFNVQASFFILGKRAQENPQILKEVKKRNHLIGNHTFSHNVGDFKKCDDIIRDILDEETKFIRPPFYDLSFCDLESKYLASKIIVTGDIDSKDYLAISINEVVKNSVNKTKNGSIIDFHDGSEKDSDLSNRAIKTIKALPSIITELKKRDFTFCTLDNMPLPLIKG